MPYFLEKFRRKADKWCLIVVFGLLYIISQIIIISILNNLNTNLVLELQLSFSTEKFRKIINLWNDKGVLGLYKKHFYFDFPHSIWYSMFLSLLMLKVFNLNHTHNRHNYLLLFPFIAGLFDQIENSLHLIIISDINNISRPVVFMSSIASYIKWLLIFISLVVIIQHSVKLKINSLIVR